jgi:uncharacterized protein involved in exopolysaccharide biosynthesis
MAEEISKVRRLISAEAGKGDWAGPTNVSSRNDAHPEGLGPVGPAQDSDLAAVLQHYLNVLRHRVWTVVSVAVATVLLTYIILQTQPDLYEVQASLLVKLGRENADVPVTVASGNFVPSGVRKEDINSEVTLLTSEPLIETAVDKVGIDRFFPVRPPPVTLLEHLSAFGRSAVKAAREGVEEAFIALRLTPRLSRREKAVLAVKRNLSVKRDGESDVILVTLRLPDKKLAAELVTNLIDLYLSQRINVRSDERIQGVFEEKMQRFRKEMEKLDAERDAMRRAMNLSGSKQERDNLLRRRENVKELIATARRDIALMDTEAAPFRPSETPGGLAHASIEPFKVKIAELQMERARLQQQSTGTKRIGDLDKEIAVLRGLALATLEASIKKLEQEVADIDSRIQELNKGEDDLDRLQQEYALAQTHYVNYAKRFEDARTDEELNSRRVANIAVLSVPTNPAEPSSPRRVMLILASIPIGLLLGVSLAIFLDTIDGRLREPSDIGKAGLVYLGTFNCRGNALARVRANEIHPKLTG